MQCPQCDAPVTGDTRFCTQCGAPLPQAPVETPTGSAAPRKTARPRCGLVFIITAAIWILGSLVVALLWMNDDDTPSVFLASIMLNAALLSAVVSSLVGMPGRAGLLGLFGANLAAWVVWVILRALLLLIEPSSDAGEVALGIVVPGLVAILVAAWYSRLIAVVTSAAAVRPLDDDAGDDQGA